jgi:hypothetical protein
MNKKQKVTQIGSSKNQNETGMFDEGGREPYVGTPEAEHIEHANGAIDIQSEKTPVMEPSKDVGANEYATDVKVVIEGLWGIEGDESDIADHRGQLLYPLIMNLREGHYGKMANGRDPCKKVASEPGYPLSAKQTRRLFNRFAYITRLKQQGESYPFLGVGHYTVTERIKDDILRLAVLKKAEREHYNVERTLEAANESLANSNRSEKVESSDASEKPQIPAWRKQLRRVVADTARKITNLAAEMSESGMGPNEDDLMVIDELASAIEQFRNLAVTEEC